MKPFSWINDVWVLAIILGLMGASCTTRVTPDIRPPTPDPWPLTSNEASTSKEPDAITRARVQEAYGKLPLHFEPNRGQTDPQVKFLSRGKSYTLFLTPTEAVLSLYKPRKDTLAPVSGERDRVRGSNPEQTNLAKPETQNSQLETVLRMQLVDANPTPQVVELEELPGKSNYFIGNDPKKWHTNIPTYARVRYQDVYPGIDLVYYGNQRQLEHDFIVAPGADPNMIRFTFDGLVRAGLVPAQEGRSQVSPLQIDDNGDLILQTAGSEVRLRKPLIYQEINGVKQPIPGGYVLLSPQSSSLITFEVAAYDTSKPLVIDPIMLIYSTYLGGSGTEGNASGVSGDGSIDIAVDAAGHAYVTGTTFSPDFPTTSGAFDTTCGTDGTCNGGFDAFVTKFNPAGTALLYSTYLGGSGNDTSDGIAVDATGRVYVTGVASLSPDFPTTLNAFQGTAPSNSPAFVVVLDPSQVGVNQLVYSTYLGGSGIDHGTDIAVDFSSIAVDALPPGSNVPPPRPPSSTSM